MPNFQLVTTADAWETVARRIENAPEIAVDTEFHREHSYWARVMLIQVALRDEIIILDPLAPELRPRLKDLAQTLCRVPCLIGHALDQDLAILERLAGHLPSQVFDTQVAAAFVGLGERLGLAALASQVAQVTLEKGLATSDWERRPISPQQLGYAADDVAHLFTIADALRAELARRGRESWAAQENDLLLEPSLYLPPDPDTLAKKLRTKPKNEPSVWRAVRRLVEEREAIAAESDIPRNFVLADEFLVDLARRSPSNPKTVSQTNLRGNSKNLERYSHRWLAALERAKKDPLPQEPRGRRILESGQDNFIAIAKMLAANILRDAQVASSSTLNALEGPLAELTESPPSDLASLQKRLGLKEWRAELLGPPLWALVSGQLEPRVERGAGLELKFSPKTKAP